MEPSQEIRAISTSASMALPSHARDRIVATGRRALNGSTQDRARRPPWSCFPLPTGILPTTRCATQARKAHGTTSTPRRSPKRLVLARRPYPASRGAEAAPPALSVPVSDTRSHEHAGPARARMRVSIPRVATHGLVAGDAAFGLSPCRSGKGERAVAVLRAPGRSAAGACLRGGTALVRNTRAHIALVADALVGHRADCARMRSPGGRHACRAEQDARRGLRDARRVATAGRAP